MAAITLTTVEYAKRDGHRLYHLIGTSAANSADTLTGTVPGGRALKLASTSTTYSGSPTQAGVTTTINSVNGAGYDTLLNTSTANGKYNVYSPSSDIWVVPGDSVDVAAPAGGSGQTAAIVIILEEA